MGLVLLWLALAGASQLWLCFRVARSSVALAIVTFFLGPIGALYTLFTHHGDEETSVTVPFIANFVFCLLLMFSGWQVVKTMWQEQMEREAAYAAEDEDSDVDVSDRLPPPGQLQPAAMSSPAPAPAPAVVADPIDAYSAALRQAGVSHSLTRIEVGSNKLPAGVVDAAQVVAQEAAAADAARPAPKEFSVTLLRCDTVQGCRDLAGAHMRQSTQVKRIIQNGAMLLVVPGAEAGSGDALAAALTSAFRQLP
ncbi:hypothetical protein M8A51_21900 [Schlegelella sp. S2-27]|uniref:Uncharacterized protein n=1 Tax=Caldimonas mangrovi TaxID=2944811 RepID=A0ABT0YTV7_9BURK|nr:hypothetical protein [Caldimonas mangrovi]MCM5682190.1 hypothetical protein [Caldimonas mangrovi]